MPSPQIEDGHTDIANELVDQFCKLRLNTVDWMVLWAVIRKTWGWHKKSDKTSLSQLQELTGLSRPSVVRGIDKLVAQMILVKDQSAYINSYQINKDYSKWVSSNTGATSSTGATKVVTPVQPKLVTPVQHTKEKKETIQKNPLTQKPKIKAGEKMRMIINGFAAIKKYSHTKEQRVAFFKRNVRAAKSLSPYPLSKITLTMAWLQLNPEKNIWGHWTLETVGKKIDDVSNTNKKLPLSITRLAREIEERCTK